jgi:hypothetical protein
MCDTLYSEGQETINNNMNKEQILHVRMDRKLYKQLKEYASRNNEGIVSMTARKALQKFIDEQKQNDQKTKTFQEVSN